MRASSRQTRPKRRDEFGRAFAGSQLHIQVWVNCRTAQLTTAVTEACRLPKHTALRWLSPVPPTFREFRDGAFLRALGLEARRAELKAFWPKGGPVWDGLATEHSRSGALKTVVLVEAKSYPSEVRGPGCKAKVGSVARSCIEKSLDDTARWIGVQRTGSWLGAMYQSANRLAHLYFLREHLGMDAYMVNVCFEGDRRRPTSRDAWRASHLEFREALGLATATIPWIADIVLPATTRDELDALVI